MNKTVTFILGTLLGAAGGSAATYFITKEILQNDEDARLMDMEEYYEERIEKEVERRLNKSDLKPEKKPEEEIEEKSSDRDDEKITNNKGVKKYHHDNGLESAYGSARIFGNDAKPKKEVKNVKEISEKEFLDDKNGYEKQSVDIFMSNDDDEPEIFGIWAYETDNEEPVDKRFGKSTSDLLDGRTYDDLIGYCRDVTPDGEEFDSEIGVLYLKNDELKTDFEFIIHNN